MRKHERAPTRGWKQTNHLAVSLANKEHDRRDVSSSASAEDGIQSSNRRSKCELRDAAHDSHAGRTS